MTDLEWFRLANQKMSEQNGKCGVCGRPLTLMTWPRPQLAHRVKRGTVVKKLGKEYEWHPKLLTLVCPNTSKGKNCNSAAMVGSGIPQQELLDEVME